MFDHTYFGERGGWSAKTCFLLKVLGCTVALVKAVQYVIIFLIYQLHPMCLQGFDLLAKWESRQNSRACISNSTESEVEVLLKNLLSTFFYLHIQLHFYKQFIYE
mgnify:CR=1 FL=1